jgi:hypothetical protein
MPLAELYRSVFPSIPEGTFYDLLRYFKDNPHLEKWVYAPTVSQHLAQGDVVEALPTCFIDAEGIIKNSKEPIPAILLSNTCDMSMDCGEPRKQFYTIVPLFPFVEERYEEGRIREIMENTLTDTLYLPNIPALKGSYIAQLDMACSISSEYVHRHMEKQKRTSLSRNGYYYFMAKLSLHLTRPENELERCAT